MTMKKSNINLKEVLNQLVEAIDKGEVSDGYHTFNELYHYRLLYNAAFFNELAKNNVCKVVKSKRHHDGKECFGGGWFIVMAELPTGQISNHYELKDWDYFKCREVDIAPEWDGHTPEEAARRLEEFITRKIEVSVGEIVHINGESFICIKSNDSCEGCDLIDVNCQKLVSLDDRFICIKDYRNDKNSVIFKKLKVNGA